MKWYSFIFTVIFSLFLMITPAYAEKMGKAAKPPVKVPSSVMNIAKENTYPNSTQDQPYLQPSDFTKQLLKSSNVKIENPDLIRIFNESNINKSPFSIGLRATIFLGLWPLNYESAETSPNWEYQKINTNYFDNRGGRTNYQFHYVQESQKVIKGGLTAKIPNSEDVKKMMLIKAMDNTNLPLSFDTIVGAGTKKDQIYNIPPKRLGYLYAYAPAVNEKGKVTYGEVYLVLKGTKRIITVKNVTSQGIGAWIPVQDHVSFGFAATERPR
ncbi:YfkD famly protein [Falsibacillus pallidus]|uniref:YfkD-like protein n=1 Tax=Falsibacillus pallidus TaxID=493781 RepID=A0A370GEJ9_9BACI|nr:YfkD-like protein [Falsibacillus pallidus]